MGKGEGFQRSCMSSNRVTTVTVVDAGCMGRCQQSVRAVRGSPRQRARLLHSVPGTGISPAPTCPDTVRKGYGTRPTPTRHVHNHLPWTTNLIPTMRPSFHARS